jgi:hypothetical protein
VFAADSKHASGKHEVSVVLRQVDSWTRVVASVDDTNEKETAVVVQNI